MVIAIIASSLLAALASYALVAYRDRSLVNVLTPRFLILVPIQFVLELFSLLQNNPEYSIFAYAYVYATYAVQHLIFAVAYCCSRPSRMAFVRFIPKRHYSVLALVLIFLAVALYAPIVWEFRDMLWSPRMIYLQTRRGYGPLFFGSDLALNLSFLLLLLWRDRPRGLATVGFIACVLLAFLHGSKGQVLVPASEWLLFYVYGKGNRVGALGFFGLAGASAAALTLLFALTMNAAAIYGIRVWGSAEEFAQALADYSDYNRNAMLVIDHKMDAAYGRLTYENQIYSRIPRFAFPNKPRFYGSFSLDDEFYPVWSASDSGTPDFSIGLQYADFGSFGIVYLALWAAATGWLQRVFVDRFRGSRSPGDFVMLLFFAGVPMIDLGASAYLLPEHLIIAFALNAGLRIALEPGERPSATGVMRPMQS